MVFGGSFVSNLPISSMQLLHEQELSQLNTQQKKAVETLDGPVLISAAAGTGKTKVLTLRYVHIINMQKAAPHQILAVTFTNKAAQEMKNRLSTYLNKSVNSLWIGTFHSLSLRILRTHAAFCDRTSSFSVLDITDQLGIIRKLLKSMNGAKQYTPKSILGKISRWKQKALEPEDIDSSDPFLTSMYFAYQATLKDVNGFDFDDLLVQSLKLFLNHSEILSAYQAQFSYLLVDEYQDINHVQYEWLKALAGDRSNICCVGDDDQSIYGWRGANVENILQFSKDFPGAEIIYLEQNYRSTPHILSAASHLISHNQRRYDKTLRTSNTIGEKIYIQGLWDSPEESAFIAQKIIELQKKENPLSTMAILVRAGFQTREFEERFILQNIPYRIIGNTRFYERQEIRDFLGYLRAIHAPSDALAFERIVNTPKRGVGSTALQHFYQLSHEEGIPLEEAAKKLCATLRVGTKEALQLFLSQLQSWREYEKNENLTDFAQKVLKESGYLAMWENQKEDPQAEGRIENLKDLIKTMDQFSSLEEFLEHISLLIESVNESTHECVSLMTIHAAKGLEFDTVFLAGWEENVFPHIKCLQDLGQKGLEEERRLAYVGITRARTRAFISFCWNRKMPQGWTASSPSRFIDQLPPQDIILNLHSPFRRPASFSHFKQKTSTPLSPFKKGVRVSHQLFGMGIIHESRADILSISFDTHGLKKVSARFVNKC